MTLAVSARRALARLDARPHPCIAGAVALLVAALLMPDVPLPRNTYTYMVTFDITQSMSVEDVSLDGAVVSRLALARAAMRDAVRRLPCGSRVGWSVFTEYRSFTLLLPIEVCSNYDVLLTTLEAIDGRMRWANASNVGKGLYWSLRYGREIARAVGTTHIVFITDGQEAPPLRAGQQAMPTIDPNEVAGVGGWLIGVGGDTPSRIPRTDAAGLVTGYWAAESVTQKADVPPGESHEHLSELREPHLRSLAETTGLDYWRLTTPDSLTEALLDTRYGHRAPAATRLAWIPALLALCLLVACHWPDVRRRGRSSVALPTSAPLSGRQIHS